jgi:formamidopyrimidine-DNA glycosylase
MPELPEVETTVRELNKKILGLKIKDVWTDWAKSIKRPKNFSSFKKQIVGRKIEKIERRGKNILFQLSGKKTLLIHQKMTGHLLVGKWQLENKKWKPLIKGVLEEKVNGYIHLMFCLSSGPVKLRHGTSKMLGLSDLRKFAKILLVNTKDLEELKDIKDIGPDPLTKSFTFNKFKERITGRNKKGKDKRKIKQVLLKQEIISGIGNIYSDEILFEAKIYPLKEIQKLREAELKKIYSATKKILKKAIKVKGDSMSDYRTTSGKKGGYQNLQKVYQREGEKCYRCGAVIERLKLGGRSCHFCPACQRLKA